MTEQQGQMALRGKESSASLQGKGWSHFPLYAVLAIFGVPMLVAWVLFEHPTQFHLKSLHHGVLMTPMQKTDNPSHRWRVIYVTHENCGKACKLREYQLQQMRKLLGQSAERVVIEQRAGLQQLTQGQIYLVDPLGNIFMSYPEAIQPLAIFKDLKRLLQVSQVG